ncbi:MAG: hypothetical protein HYZ73_09080 [Elusimicrobia bacterium]|nr:hypothetical protein [Elusimicrobiota bacterium]
MTFRVRFTSEAKVQYDQLPAAKLKKVKRALGYLQTNPRHPSLNTHLYSEYKNPFHPKEPVFEAYAENVTPGAYRIFWCYGPERFQVTIIAITPHP